MESPTQSAHWTEVMIVPHGVLPLQMKVELMLSVKENGVIVLLNASLENLVKQVILVETRYNILGLTCQSYVLLFSQENSLRQTNAFASQGSKYKSAAPTAEPTPVRARQSAKIR